MAKTTTSKNGGRKFASGAGRKKHKRGGEPQKETKDPRESRSRTGSSRQRKG
jgi:hypothetical protein